MKDWTMVIAASAILALAATERFCQEPEGTMEQEQEYLAALGTVATWNVDRDQLDLRTAEGSRAVSYTAGEPAE